MKHRVRGAKTVAELKKTSEGCYVCGKPITKCRNKINVGNGLYRHLGCQPGCNRWLKSHVGKNSSTYEFFAMAAVRRSEKNGEAK